MVSGNNIIKIAFDEFSNFRAKISLEKPVKHSFYHRTARPLP